MSKAVNSMTPLLIEDNNLSHAWGRILVHVMEHPGKTVSPLIVSITGFADNKVIEDPGIRKALDKALIAAGKDKVETVANTIFPSSVWRYAEYDRHVLYKEYLESIPRYRALAKTKNNRGLYFERLIRYSANGKQVNQLEFIIEQYRRRKGVRDSMFQATTFDPTSDHTAAAQLGFPCLQHVSFVGTKDDQLVLNAFYATQQLFDKAYGNYLGLCQLGHFMAREMKLKFGRLNCFIGVEKLERATKGELDSVLKVTKAALKSKGN